MGHLRCDVILLRLNNPSRLVFLKFWIRRIAETFLEVLTKRSKHENCLLEPLDPIKRQQRSLNAKFPVSLACPVSRLLCERRYWLRVVLSLLFIDCRILGTTGWGWMVIIHTLHFVRRFKTFFHLDLSAIFRGKKFETKNNRTIITTVVDDTVKTLIRVVHSKVLSRAIEKIQSLVCYFLQIQTLRENHFCFWFSWKNTKTQTEMISSIGG